MEGTLAEGSTILALPEDCLSHILSLTSPRDACRSAAVSSKFRSASESDVVWERFLKSRVDHNTDHLLLSSFKSPHTFASKKCPGDSFIGQRNSNLETMIKVISSSNILPNCTDKSRQDRLELIPCDLVNLLVTPIQQNCLIFKKGNSSFNAVVDHLKASLSKALDIYYPLAGRLSVSEDSGTATYSVDCRAGSDGGALFIHAVADGISVDDLLGPRECLRRFYPLNHQGVSEPLLAVQVTEIADGIVLGLTASHVAIDGTSFWQFMNAWSHIARSVGDYHLSLSPPPIFDRSGLFEGVFDLPIRVPSLVENSPTSAPEKNLAVASRIFGFSKETIAELKARANSEAGGDRAISSFQALMAHLWVSVTRSRGLDSSEAVYYSVVVELRSRTSPKLPEGYFGNAIKFAIVRSTAGEILSGERGFGTAARLINEAISAQTPVNVRSFLKEWAETPVIPRGGSVPPNLMITGGSPRFEVFKNDFGWGPPEVVRCGGAFMDGVAMPMPGAAGDGSVDFEVCLSPDSLLALARGPDFVGRPSLV